MLYIYIYRAFAAVAGLNTDSIPRSGAGRENRLPRLSAVAGINTSDVAPFVGNTPMGLIKDHDNRLGTSSDSYLNAT